MYNKRKPIFTVVGEDDDEEEEEQPIWCKHCLSYGFRVRMLVGQKILMVGEQRPPDFDQWLNFPDCSSVIAIHELEKEASIKDAVETVESPFENQSEIIGVFLREVHQQVGRQLQEERRKDMGYKGKLNVIVSPYRSQNLWWNLLFSYYANDRKTAWIISRIPRQ